MTATEYLKALRIYNDEVIYNSVDEKDTETIISFMQKHWDKLNRIWAPISKIK